MKDGKKMYKEKSLELKVEKYQSYNAPET